MYNEAMLLSISASLFVFAFALICLVVGYLIGRLSSPNRQREPAEPVDDVATRLKEEVRNQSEILALKVSEAEHWKSGYESMQQSYNSMSDAYESMKQAADSYEQASNSNRQAYEDMKAANESLREIINGDKATPNGN
jgi:methyl-accepting chemotaxis protein